MSQHSLLHSWPWGNQLLLVPARGCETQTLLEQHWVPSELCHRLRGLHRVLSFNCSAATERGAAFYCVSAKADIFFSQSATAAGRRPLSRRRVRLFFGSRTRPQRQQQCSGSTLRKHTSCSSHTARPAHAPRAAEWSSLVQWGCISGLTQRNFPVSFYEKKTATEFLVCPAAGHIGSNRLQLDVSCKSTDCGLLYLGIFIFIALGDCGCSLKLLHQMLCPNITPDRNI